MRYHEADYETQAIHLRNYFEKMKAAAKRAGDMQRWHEIDSAEFEARNKLLRRVQKYHNMHKKY